MNGKAPQMESCGCCHGIMWGGESPVECWICKGSGWVEKRDERGRFLPWVPAGSAHSTPMTTDESPALPPELFS